MATKKQVFNTFSDSDSPVENYLNNKKRVVEFSNNRSASISAEQELIMKRKRSIVLKLATNTGIKEPNDWKRFNGWMKEYSILKKELHAYTYDELDDLTKQFRALQDNYTKSAIKTGTKAWHHANGIPVLSQN